MHHSRGCLRWRGQVVVGGGCHSLPSALASDHLGRRRRGHEHFSLIAAVLAMLAVRSLDLRAMLAGAAASLARGSRLSSIADLHIIHNSGVHLAPRALCDRECVMLYVVGRCHASSFDLIVGLGRELGR